MNERIEQLRTIGYGLLGVALLAVAAIALLWPGPLALSDRLPFGLLFAIPAAVILNRLRRLATGSRIP